MRFKLSKYTEELRILKALSDNTRLEIIEMLSCNEMCACDLLGGLAVNQSTLSHHMKVLTESGLIISKKEATWMYYSINRQIISKIHQFIDELVNHKEDCECQKIKTDCKNKEDNRNE